MLFASQRSAERSGPAAGVVCALLLVLATLPALAGINLEWRPLTQTVNVGEPVGVGLFAVSDTGQNEPFNSAQVIMTWENSFLQLTGVNQAGAVLQPPSDSSGFPAGDSFGSNELNPPADGDGIWFGFVEVGQTRNATTAGSLLTTIMFTALANTPATPVTMLYSAQKPGRPMAYTKINQGTYNVLGTLSGPSIVTIGELPPTGACCLPNAECAVLTSTGCDAAGGSYRGDGTSCEPNPCVCPGDMDCDGLVDFDDINLFVAALSYPGGVGWPFPCPWLSGDCNGDHDVTFDDINAFVARMGAYCD